MLHVLIIAYHLLIPGRNVISEKLSAKTVKYYLNNLSDTNHFLRKLKYLGRFPEKMIPCTVCNWSLPKAPHEEGLSYLRKHLNLRPKQKFQLSY